MFWAKEGANLKHTLDGAGAVGNNLLHVWYRKYRKLREGRILSSTILVFSPIFCIFAPSLDLPSGGGKTMPFHRLLKKGIGRWLVCRYKLGRLLGSTLLQSGRRRMLVVPANRR